MRAKALFKAGLVECQDCHQLAARTGPVQRYCSPCSSKRDDLRKRNWAHNHHQTVNPRVRALHQSAIVEDGAQRSLDNRASILWTVDAPSGDGIVHAVRVAVPFDYAASKNAVWRVGRGGHVYARQEANEFRENLSAEVRLAGGLWFEGKVWIDIFVEKPNHRGDAINVVDLVCDAVKDAIGVDDRWYSIRRLDWAIVKENPRLYVGIAQSVTEAHRVCSYCGRTLPVASGFGRNKSMKNGGGFGRTCLECGKLSRRKTPA